MRNLMTKGPIPAGEVICGYLGHMDIFSPPCKNAARNEGYRMHLKTLSGERIHVSIDALDAGGLLRLMNRSCNPCARFHEVQTGIEVTVIAVAVRDILSGEQVTISYGDKLCFICRCDWWGYQHKYIQHLSNILPGENNARDTEEEHVRERGG